MKKQRTEIEHEEGSGNVFADLGLDDADWLYARAQLGIHVHRLLTARKLQESARCSASGSRTSLT